MNSTRQVTLAIESAIGGGSISLLDGEQEVANWIGNTDVLRAAEDLLPEIDKLITANGISLRDIDLIAVSAGPGSFTGIRIGIATALGLKTGLGIRLASQSALRAMASAFDGEGEIIAAVPAGRNAVCWQLFERSEGRLVERSEPEAIAENQLRRLSENNKDLPLLVHSAIVDKVSTAGVVDFGTNVARAMGIYCHRNPDVIAEPLFVSKNF